MVSKKNATADDESGGIVIPETEIEWRDGKTDVVYDVPLATLTVPVILWAIRHGLKQSVTDAHSGEKDKGKAHAMADARLAVILAGGVSTRAGGRRSDPVVAEAIASLIVASGMTRGAFVKTFGTGAASVAAAVLRLVVNAVAAKYGEEKADAAFADGKLNTTINDQIEKVMEKAKAEVDRRRATNPIDVDVTL
jgi:hypothetical protein